MSSDGMPSQLPGNVIVYGPNANCTLDICPVEWSVYQYRPSLPANVTFIALFSLAMIVHIILGIRWKTWSFMTFMILGCTEGIIGYIGRILLWKNPFSFPGFMIQIVCVTSAPVFYTAAIYITLSRIITQFGLELSRFNPKLFYWIFIPADIICLVLQAAGGGLSSSSSGSSQAGVDIAMAGLILQVIILVAFCVLLGDYLFRYFRQGSAAALTRNMKLFFTFLCTAVILILTRCLFRCYELSEGYVDSEIITHEGLFIGLEGVLIVLAVFCLCIAHPGLVFKSEASSSHTTSDNEKEPRGYKQPVTTVV